MLLAESGPDYRKPFHRTFQMVDLRSASVAEGPWVSVLFLQHGGTRATPRPRGSCRAICQVLASTRNAGGRQGLPEPRAH